MPSMPCSSMKPASLVKGIQQGLGVFFSRLDHRPGVLGTWKGNAYAKRGAVNWFKLDGAIRCHGETLHQETVNRNSFWNAHPTGRKGALNPSGLAVWRCVQIVLLQASLALWSSIPDEQPIDQCPIDVTVRPAEPAKTINAVLRGVS